MKNLIRKILKEGDDLKWAEEVVSTQSELPFEILDPTKPPPIKRNMFVVRSNWMSGDADAYNDEKHIFNVSDEKDFNEFIIICRVYNLILKNRRGYHDWRDLNKILNPYGYKVRDWRKQLQGEDVGDYINSDVFSDGDAPARLENVSIKYFNKDGVEYNVKLK